MVEAQPALRIATLGGGANPEPMNNTLALTLPSGPDMPASGFPVRLPVGFFIAAGLVPDVGTGLRGRRPAQDHDNRSIRRTPDTE